jgi:hypothetical protein
MPLIDGYKQFGGIHPETASLTNVLAAVGVENPQTHKPFSEAMLLGIGGGLGAGYIMWEFQEHHIKVLVLAFHHRWQYPMQYYQSLCDRIGVSITMPETGSRKAATEILEKSLANGKPAVAWVDRAHMPYLQMPEAMKGHLGHFVAVCGTDGTDTLIDDLAAAPFRVPASVFADARARIGSYKNRLLLVENTAPINLTSAINQGLQTCVDHLSSDSDSFSLPTLRKWGRMMTDTKNKKGWLNLFSDGRGLYGTLRSAFEGIELTIGGGGLRGLYAAFLLEASDVTGNTKLRAVAHQYRDLAAMWTRLAETLLPDAIELLRETKALLREQHRVMIQGGSAWQTTQPLTANLRALSAQLNLTFPMDEAGKRSLFEQIQEQVLAIYEAEKLALAALANAI